MQNIPYFDISIVWTMDDGWRLGVIFGPMQDMTPQPYIYSHVINQFFKFKFLQFEIMHKI